MKFYKWSSIMSLYCNTENLALLLGVKPVTVFMWKHVLPDDKAREVSDMSEGRLQYEKILKKSDVEAMLSENPEGPEVK